MYIITGAYSTRCEIGVFKKDNVRFQVGNSIFPSKKKFFKTEDAILMAEDCKHFDRMVHRKKKFIKRIRQNKNNGKINIQICPEIWFFYNPELDKEKYSYWGFDRENKQKVDHTSTVSIIPSGAHPIMDWVEKNKYKAIDGT